MLGLDYAAEVGKEQRPQLPCFLLRTLHFSHHISCMTLWYQGQVLCFTPELAGFWLFTEAIQLKELES